MNDTTPAPGAWPDADLVPISALQHHAYCPRQCALIHVEQVWDENVYTLRGRRAHERVDTAGGATRDGVRTEHALPLFSDRLGLVGKADVVEFGPDGTPLPVEHKVGSRSKGAWARLADEVQVVAQAVCLEEMTGREVSRAALFYGKTRRRVEVDVTAERRADLARRVAEVRALLAESRLPAPVADGRCPRCSLVETCMPDVVARLGDPEPDDGDDP
ncbi:CRISPR-associated protein Cas4 [Rubrivirga sp.]|uniref:CRISPR-associated protein Cas4 n=1 Tax=Rubrivirga sp. TaxID=1885344 RepID=UPI003B522F2A